MNATTAVGLIVMAIVCSGTVALVNGIDGGDKDTTASAEAASVANVVANDNRTPAGTWQGDTLVLRLVAQEAVWHIHEARDGGFNVPAFAEEGKLPTIPGPLIRVRAGTPIRLSVRNSLTDSLIVRGLTGRAAGLHDSLFVAPGATVETRFTADREGSYFYSVLSTQQTAAQQFPPVSTGRWSQLTGAFVVDPRNATGAPTDRVFVITEHLDTPGNMGVQDARGVFLRDYVAFNGKSWPHTERLSYALGDTVRWRIINAAAAPHSMHLHGFYYRVVASGSNSADTALAPPLQRMAVTEQLSTGRTMTMAWVPERPGGWIFHCHMTPHIARHPPIDRPDIVAFPHEHAHGDPDTHLQTGMNGLLLGVTVSGNTPTRAASTNARRIRLFVQSDSTPGDSLRRFGYVLQRNTTEPARDSLEATSPLLIAYRDEPTHIEVVNRSGEATAVHWHGIELESYFDGVVGFGGTPGRFTPAIRSGTSFEARMTPPRAGTFMYHTHFDELRQQFGGLAGPLIVLEPGERWDAQRERIFVISDAFRGGAGINGATQPPVLELRAGTTYRFRFANIAADRPLFTVYLMRDSTTLATWRPIAKDGWTLPAARATSRPSWQRIGTGETADFEFTPETPGDLLLEVRGGNAATVNADRTRRLIVTQVLRVSR